MIKFSHFAAAAAFTLTGALAAPVLAQPSLDVSTAPAGTYEIDKGHAFIFFKINHLGFSNIIGRFNEFESTLELDPENLSNSSVAVTIQTASIDVGNKAFEDHLRSDDLFDSETYPEISFVSTSLTRDSDEKGKLTGDLTMHGETKPVTFDVTFNGTGPHFRSGKQVLGFSAMAKIDRSEWGITYALPNVPAEVTLVIEAEYHHADAE